MDGRLKAAHAEEGESPTPSRCRPARQTVSGHPMPTRAAARYEDDFYSWTLEQAAALHRAASSRVNLPEPLDLANLAEEIESLGAFELREPYSRYLALLMHLLRWQHQPERRTPSWRATIRTQRHELARLLKTSPP
jgi:hypothetical protein